MHILIHLSSENSFKIAVTFLFFSLASAIHKQDTRCKLRKHVQRLDFMGCVSFHFSVSRFVFLLLIRSVFFLSLFLYGINLSRARCLVLRWIQQEVYWICLIIGSLYSCGFGKCKPYLPVCIEEHEKYSSAQGYLLWKNPCCKLCLQFPTSMGCQSDSVMF